MKISDKTKYWLWVIIGCISIIVAVLYFFCMPAKAQTIKIKLRPDSRYYDSTVLVTEKDMHGKLANQKDRFVLFESYNKWGMFKAHKDNIDIYVLIDDVVSTKAYEQYFSKYFFGSVLEESNKALISVNLSPGSYYYLDTANVHKNDTVKKGDRFLLLEPLPKWGMFKAKLKDMDVFVTTGTIIKTPEYEKYFKSYYVPLYNGAFRPVIKPIK